MTKAMWEQFQMILSELKVRPMVNVIHAGDASKPTGVMVRVALNTKFNVMFDEPVGNPTGNPPAQPESKRGRKRK